MAGNNYTKHDEEFKKLLILLHQNGKLRLSFVKDTAFPNLLWANGLNNMPPSTPIIDNRKMGQGALKTQCQLKEEKFIKNNCHHPAHVCHAKA